MVLIADNRRKKASANVNGFNSIDPQRTVIPISHCPVGLVDKVLEPFKAWVNLEVDDLNYDTSETIQSPVHKLATDHQKAAKIAYQQQEKALR